MDTGPDFFLEVLCLVVCCDDMETDKIVQNVLNTYHDEVNNGSAINDELSKFYIKMITEFKNSEIDLNNEFELSTFLLKFDQHPGVSENPRILEHIRSIIDNREKLSDMRITHMKAKIKKWVVWVAGNRSLKNLFRTSQKVIGTSDLIMQDTLMDELLNRARDLTKTYEDNTHIEDSHIDFIDMTCPSSIKAGLESYKRKRIAKGFKMGLQGLRRMFGKAGGPALGEFIGFCALSHHYKSGILMDIARWLVTLNEPRVMNNKPAAIVFISLENEIYENLMMWFKAAYENLYSSPPPVAMPDNEIIEKISELYGANGYKLLVYRKEGDLFGYEEWRDLHTELSETYTINASILDYIGLMKLPENSKVNDAKQRQEQMCKIKNYANRNEMTTVTGLQLDGEAEKLSASGITNVVKRFGAGHLADCKGAKREFDFLAALHIEINNMGQRFLTMNWLKHKYVSDTPQADKYCAYQFFDGIGIPDDVHGKDASVKDIYATEGNGELGGTGTTSSF